MMKRILVWLLALVCTACTKQSDLGNSLGQPQTQRNAKADSGEGGLYINALAAAIQNSDKIVVTEHSNVDDALDVTNQLQRPENYSPIIFTTHELSLHERADFLAAVKSMAVRTQDAETACIFEPHHTITFYRENKQTSAMRVCFQCGQVEWDGTTKMQPWSLVPTLGNLISGLGMKEERDWYALAKTASK